MLHRRRAARKDPGNVVFGTIGWLFADLMVALAMAFLVATTVGMPAPDPKPTQTKATPTPTPSTQLGLENVPVKIKLSVDYQGLLNGDGSARDVLLKKVKADTRLAERDAGLVLAFGGADNSAAGIDRAMKIAGKANEALKVLGRTEAFVFSANTAYTPYIDYGNAPSTLELRVYLFKR